MDVTETFKRAVQHRPNHTATIYRGRTRTWGEIGDRVPRLADSLRTSGIARGDRIAVLAMNSDDYLEIVLAASWIGAIIVPVNTRWSIAEMRSCIEDCAPRAIFFDDEFLGDYPDELRIDPNQIAVHAGFADTPAGLLRYEDLVHDGSWSPAERLDPRSTFGIFYTGGTTGKARGAEISHSASVAMSLMWSVTLHFDDHTRYLHSASFFHLAGAAPLLALVMQSATSVILPKFEARAVLEAIEKEKVNYCLFVPTMLSTLIADPAVDAHDLTSVEYCEYGAAPMPEALLETLLERLPTWQFIQGYGCTEAGALVTSLQWEFHSEEHRKAGRLRSAGRSASGASVKIVDPFGKEVERGEIGEIAVRSPGMMTGYWRNEEATDRVLRDGWLYTGDGARMDAEGFIYIVDRIKDMIVTGGENVYSIEVEQAIYSHDGVAQCAVFGIPDTTWGEAVHAVVVPKPGVSLTEAAILARCRELIAGYKCPRAIVIRDDGLPLTGAGKIKKNELKMPYWENSRRLVN